MFVNFAHPKSTQRPRKKQIGKQTSTGATVAIDDTMIEPAVIDVDSDLDSGPDPALDGVDG